MTKNDYLEYRRTGNALLLWEYYNEKYNGPNKADVNKFMDAMFQYPFKGDCFETVVREYDARFNIMTVSDKITGEIIKVY